MRRRILRLLGAGLVSVLMLTAFAGCGSTEDSDQDFGDEEYTPVYLAGEYAEQLINDGAKTLEGTITITGEKDNYTVQVQEKEVVVNENYDGGYYIADRNLSNEYAFGGDVGLVVDKGGTQEVCTVEDFIADTEKDPDALYTVYIMGDAVELILPLDPRDVVAGQFGQ